MADSPELIHPIIQAMLANQEATQQGRALVEKQRSAKEEEKLRRDQLAQAMEIHKQDLAHQQALLEVHKKQVDADLKMAGIQRSLGLAKLIGEGAQPQDVMTQPAQAPQGNLNEVAQMGVQPPQAPQTSGMQQLPGLEDLGSFPAGTFKGPEDLQALALKHAQDISQVTEDIHNKAEDLRQRRELLVQTLKNAGAQAKQDLKDKSDQAYRNKEIDYKYDALKSEERRTAMMVAARNDSKYTPDQLANGIDQFATGARKFTGNSPYERKVSTVAREHFGYQDVDPKDIATLKAMETVKPTINALQEFKDKYLSDSGVGAFVQGRLQAGAKAIGMKTDALAALDRIKTNAFNVSKNVEGLTGGRITQQQINLILDGLTATNLTKENAQKAIDNLEGLAGTKAQNAILGGLNEAQKIKIIKSHNLHLDLAVPQPVGTSNPGSIEDIKKKHGINY